MKYCQLATAPEPWSGIRDATKNHVVCYQTVVKYKNLNISEDCLFMNVYTPVVSLANGLYNLIEEDIQSLFHRLRVL